MDDIREHFKDKTDINHFIHQKGKASILVNYRPQQDYEGMVLAIMVVADLSTNLFVLDLQWMSLGLDLYGDTLQESYQYQFASLEDLLAYLQTTYQIEVTEIPIAYQFISEDFPSPIREPQKKELFEKEWKRFQGDFKKGKWLDGSLNLIYNSLDH